MSLPIHTCIKVLEEKVAKLEEQMKKLSSKTTKAPKATKSLLKKGE